MTLPSDSTAEAVGAFAQLFPPNPLKHGRWAGIKSNGEKLTSTHDGHPVTEAMVEAHLTRAMGKFPVYGWLPGFQDGTNAGCVDLDAKDFPNPFALDDARAAIARVAETHGLKVYPERSSRGKGWHLWAWADKTVPYATMKAALKRLVSEAGHPKVEVYPMGDGPGSRWVIMPYAGALDDPKGLGRTHLEALDGRPIPLDELLDTVDPSPHGVFLELAQPRKSQQFPIISSSSAPSPGVLSELENLAQSHKPAQRHDTAVAFLNLAERAGVLEGVAEALKSETVYRVWVDDGSRGLEEWGEEVDRWLEHLRLNPEGNRRGIPYLEEQGYAVDRLSEAMRAVESARRIQTNGRHMREITEDAVKALERTNAPPHIFVRAGALVRVAERVEPFSKDSLKGALDRAADFVKIENKADKDTGETRQIVTPSRPPTDVVSDILSLPNLAFPRLEAIVSAPVYLTDGRLLATSGYDPESCTLLRLDGLEGVRCDMRPHEALGWLLGELLADFPFVTPAHRAHALALLLQPFVRPLIPGLTPLYLIEAPTRGTGKGLLAEVAGIVSTGQPLPVMDFVRDGDEFEKRVTSALLEGVSHILLDNVTRLDSPTLAAALTSETWRGRLLGKSQMLDLPNTACWIATGNNPVLSDEIARRTIPVRLDSGEERPEERREFRHGNLPAWAKAHRVQLVSACLSLVRNWQEAGSSTGMETLGRYEAWAAAMGGILEAAGVRGFLQGRGHLVSQGESETHDWKALFSHWWNRYGSARATAGDVLDLAREHGLLPDLYAGRNAMGAKQRMGHALNGHRDRRFGDYYLRAGGRDSYSGSNTYHLEPKARAAEKPPETPETPRHASGTAPEGARFNRGLEQPSGKTPGKPRDVKAVPEGLTGVSGGTGGLGETAGRVSGVASRWADEPD